MNKKTDYMLLLSLYMEHIIECEGVSFVSDCYLRQSMSINEQEKKELQRIEKIINEKNKL